MHYYDNTEARNEILTELKIRLNAAMHNITYHL